LLCLTLCGYTVAVRLPSLPTAPPTVPPRRLRAALCSAVIVGTLATAAGPVAAESYRARPGDTLSGIAQRNGISVSRLQSANAQINPRSLQPGQVLVIPSGSSSSGSSSSGSSSSGRAATTGSGTHRVGEGETLSDIAERYGLSTGALASINGITNVNRVRVGQVLSLGGGSRSTPTASPTSGRSSGVGTYTVRSGDALSTIARRLGTSSNEVLRLNGLTDGNRLRVGQVLRVPSAGSTTSSPSRPANTSSVTRRYRNLPNHLLANPDRLAHVASFERWAAQYGIPVEFLMAVTWLESGWQNSVVSNKGAVGIGQLMPVTSQWLANEVIGIGRLNPNVPDDNIRMTAAFLGWLRRSMGSTEMALAAYYQGPSSVRVLGVFPVTEVYVAAVTSLFSRFR
jgi:LysM repeat protein